MVKVLNLNDMEQSDGYNPLAYIREDEDILRLISALMDNTTPKNAQVNDPFWPSATCSWMVESLRASNSSCCLVN